MTTILPTGAPSASQPALRSLELARRLRRPWENRWQRFAELAMPYRTSFFGDGGSNGGIGTNAPIYDSTGIVCTEEMSNRLQSGIVPAGVQWARFEPERGADPELRAGLAQVQDEAFRTLDRSNFSTEASDAFKDLSGFGQGCLRISSGDWQQPLRCQAIPLPDVWITPGPDGRFADIHVRYRLPRYAVRAQWPDADLPEERDRGGAEPNGAETCHVIDSWLRDLDRPTERWLNELHLERGGHGGGYGVGDGGRLLRRRVVEGMGSCPYVFGRWSKAAGDLYGVGQGMLALPDLETLNEVSRLLMAHGEMALSGMWQAEDDGVLNPWSVRLEPGTIVPIAPHSKGLQPLVHAGSGRFEMGQLQLEERRHAIRKAMYCEQLGAREGTPPTAFEIDVRMQELMRQLGPTYHRVWDELAVPILVRVRKVLVEQGRIVMPLIDGQRLKVVSASSMVRAQGIGEMQRIKALLGDVAALFGPQAVQTMFDPQRFVRIAADRYDVPRDLAFTPAEIAANAQATGQMLGGTMAQMQEAGGGEMLAPLLAALGGKGGQPKGVGGAPPSPGALV